MNCKSRELNNSTGAIKYCCVIARLGEAIWAQILRQAQDDTAVSDCRVALDSSRGSSQ